MKKFFRIYVGWITISVLTFFIIGTWFSLHGMGMGASAVATFVAITQIVISPIIQIFLEFFLENGKGRWLPKLVAFFAPFCIALLYIK